MGIKPSPHPDDDDDRMWLDVMARQERARKERLRSLLIGLSVIPLAILLAIVAGASGGG